MDDPMMNFPLVITVSPSMVTNNIKFD